MSKAVEASGPKTHRGATLRNRVLAFVSALVLLSLFGSTLALFQIASVNRSLDSITRVSLPLSKLLVQTQGDAEVFSRELNRGLGYAHWDDPHWRPQPVSAWITEVMDGEISRAKTLLHQGGMGEEKWSTWVDDLDTHFTDLKSIADELFHALEKKDRDRASALYPRWTQSLEAWTKQLQWGASEHDRAVREELENAQSHVSDVRTGLELIFLTVAFLSGMLLWLGERALRPLADLTRLAREITRRGLKRDDKEILPGLVLGNDEVSQLAREFHRMASQLLEREKIVETQKKGLEDQNRLLKENLDLQEQLQRAESLATVGRLSAQVAHEVRNPLHSIGLEAEMALDLAQGASASIKLPALKQSLQSILSSVERLDRITENYLKLSRLSAGEKKPVLLSELLQSVLATYALSIEKHGVLIDWKTQNTGTLMIDGDRALLEQAIGNLLQNAIQAVSGQRDPRVEFSLGSLESGRLGLRIRDNGPGIPAEMRAKLFTPFMTTKAQGTGLGLSFVKKVIEEHRGEIRWVATPVGACFECVFQPVALLGQDSMKNSLKTNEGEARV